MAAGTKRINLALQGGGAHGAFTWGVLDRLLEDDGIEIAGICGTSAGALNGAALKAGLHRGGREGARKNLAWLWEQIGGTSDDALSSWLSYFTPPMSWVTQGFATNMAFAMAESASRLFSPYAMGPLYKHPLRGVVEQLDFDSVCATDGPAFFVCATNVRSGKVKVFGKDHVTADALLASACLPTMFQAIEIEDPDTGVTEAYWDGGYTGNPSLFPLYDRALPDDIVIVNINPIRRENVPVSPQDIRSRINEVSFNSSLLHDLRAIAFVKRLIAEGRIERGSMKDVLVHMIADDALMVQLTEATKAMPNPALLDMLKLAGRKTAEEFLTQHRAALNKTATVDLIQMFQ